MDDNLLSTEQILLLENLTYLLDEGELKSIKKIEEDVKPNENFTVGYVVEKLKTAELEDDKDYGSYMTGKDWKNILQAVENDETLCNMKIAEVHGDPGGVSPGEGEEKEGACSVLFVNEASGEAVVAFRGTAEYEWKDNFLAGAPTDAADGVSTEYQEKALEWYQGLKLEEGGYSSITVTGHSKGGNKAKYITIMDESVTRCLSFDGQGFSDEFYERYGREIAKRQSLIENHNVEYDFVNLLLNDVGNTYFYQGFDYGEGGILEAHCPNTFFCFDENGNVKIIAVEEQAKEMQELNRFLNSYLRILSPEKKVKTMEVLGEIVEAVFSGQFESKGAAVINDNMEIFAELVEYVALYAAIHPDFTGAIEGIAGKFFVGEDVISFFKKIMMLVVGADTVNKTTIMRYLAGMLAALTLEPDTRDKQVASIYVPLEKNRVFDISKLTELGQKGKALMMTGSESCRIWDDEVENLKGLLAALPEEARSPELEDSLSEAGTPYYSEAYETMGECIYNTTMKIVEDIPELDTDAADLLDGITGVLATGITTIKGLEEEINIY